MVVVWNKEAIERIIAALLAASPGFTPDYALMAQYFGQNATYDAIQYRFRHYRKVADKMRSENPGLSASATRTPSRRTGGGTPSSRNSSARVTKSTKQQKSPLKFEELTPSKPSKVREGGSMQESIVIDDDDDDVGLKGEVGCDASDFSATRNFRGTTIKPEPINNGFDVDVFAPQSGNVRVDGRANGYVTNHATSSFSASNYQPATVLDENENDPAAEYGSGFYQGYRPAFEHGDYDDDMA